MTRRDGPNLLQPGSTRARVADLFLRPRAQAPAPAPKAKRRRGAAPGKPWTLEEDAQLLALTSQRVRPRGSRVYVPVDWAAVERAVPGRTRYALVQRAQGLKRRANALQRSHWTPEQDELLRDAWQSLGRRKILDLFPRRSWEAIVLRATRALGLPTVPRGWAVLTCEAEALGVSRTRADTVIEWANAWEPLVVALCAWGHQCAIAWRRICEARGEAYEVAETPPDGWDGGGVRVRTLTTVRTRGPEARHRRALVEEGRLADALERWDSWQDSPTAGARYDVDLDRMRRWAVAGGWGSLHGSKHLRLPGPWWDEVARARGVARGGRSVTEHARRRGMDGETLRRRLVAAGVYSTGVTGAKRWLTDAEVDAALVARPFPAKCGRRTARAVA